MKRTLLTTAAGLGVLTAGAAAQGDAPFRRIATFPIFENTDVNNETVAEIVAATADGNTLIYSDSQLEVAGFVDITDPANPQPAGTVALPGEPTSVSVRGGFALVTVNTSPDFVNTSGSLEVIDIATQTIVRSIDLGGQPDSAAVSPDGAYAAIAIENERDEELGNGAPPQLPAGYLVIIDLIGNDPADWVRRDVDLVGVPTLFPDDPEPEFVDINVFNIAAVTLQENNHVALVSLQSGQVLTSFSAGTVDLDGIDIDEEDLIDQTASLQDVPREPDAISWIGPFLLSTADEGDLDGGSRGFTNWSVFGQTVYEAGNTVDQAVARIGHYPESRSANKGNEPESVEYGVFGGERFLFVGSERSSVVFVYRLPGMGLFGVAQPEFVQVLPTGVAPEGLLAIPGRDLFVVACEEDSRDDKIRASIMIYGKTGDGDYPTIVSADRNPSGAPIPWGALSGLAVDRSDPDTLYTVHDSYYAKSRAYVIDNSVSPAVITEELPLVDSFGRVAMAFDRIKAVLPNTPDFDPSALINSDGTVNIDLEGIATSQSQGVFWAVSEGAGNLVGGVSDPNDRPFETPNLLLRLERNVAGDALDITSVIGVPFDIALGQLRFGLEGVAEGADGAVYVAFQRAWTEAGDPSHLTRIGRFEPSTRQWTFAYYPLDAVASPFGGWVGLGDLSPLADGRIAVLERDNQGGTDAAVKCIYTIDPASVTFVPTGQTLPTLTKTLQSDLLADGVFDALAGFVFEKLEGLAVLPNGDAIINNDNDGVEDNSGETRNILIPGLIQ